MEGVPWVRSTRVTWVLLGSIVTRPSTVNEVSYLSSVGPSIKESHHFTFWRRLFIILISSMEVSSFWFILWFILVSGSGKWW